MIVERSADEFIRTRAISYEPETKMPCFLWILLSAFYSMVQYIKKFIVFEFLILEIEYKKTNWINFIYFHRKQIPSLLYECADNDINYLQ